MDSRPIISICIFSYNYEQYIAEAIESALGQQINVPFEIVIGDDLSTDSTRNIVLQYKEKYPYIIKVSFNEKNLGGTYNWVNTINQCKGKYIALMDGDDYFSRTDKCQRQYDLLEGDDKAVLSFHAIEEKYDNVEGMDEIVRFEKAIYTLEDFLSRGWFIRTSSTFFKNGILPAKPPEWVYNFPYRYDTIMHVFLGCAGHAIYIDEPLSVWRKHIKGMSLKLRENISKNILTEIAMTTKLDNHTNYKYTQHAKKNIAELYSHLFLNLLKGTIGSFNILLFIRSMMHMNWGSSFKRLKNRFLK